MGDRCYLSIEIRGPITSLKTLVKVVKAISEENLYPNGGGNDYLGELIAPGLPTFSADEVNYANIDDLEVVLQGLGVAYSVDHGSGGDYGPGCWSWCPEHGRSEADMAHGGGPVLDISVIEHAINKKGLDGVKKLLTTAWRAAGKKDLPEKMVFGGNAERYVAKRLAAEALLKGRAA
jgi:hypothetical protein